MATSNSPLPSYWCEWTIRSIEGPDHAAPPIRTRVLYDDSGRVGYGLLDVPRLVRSGGAPRFSLIIFLERAPHAGEESIRSLIVSGYLGLELDYALPPEIVSQIPATRIFARHGQLALHARGRGPLTSTPMNAPLLRGALHTHLNREELLGVIDALDGGASFMELQATIEFRAASPSSSIGMSISSAALWDLLKAASVGGMLSEDAIRAVFTRLVETSEISLPPGADVARVFQHFRQSCSLFLRPEADGCSLGKRPGLNSVTFQERWNREDMRQVNLCCALEQVLSGALDSSDREACLRVVGPSGDLSGGPLFSILQRVRPKSFRGRLGAASISIVGTKIQTVTAALQPTVHANPTAAVIATEAIPLPQSAIRPAALHYVTPHVTFAANALPENNPLSLPVVNDLNAPLFIDRIKQSLRWYLPSVQLLSPAPSEAPDTSPFLFELERIGTTASGRPAIRARVRLTLELSMPAAVSTALARLPGVSAQPINIIQPSVVLRVPYIDEADGTLKRASYRGVTTVSGGRVQAVIELLNDAARTTYGSLSTEGFQTEPARVEFSYQFGCYSPVSDRPTIVMGGKISAAQFLPHLRDDSDTIPVITGGREFRYRPEKPGLSAVVMGSTAIPAGHLLISNVATQLPQKIEYAQKTIIRQQNLDAFFACDRLGSFYREKQSSVVAAIGCAEAYRLGQASNRTYQEIPNLARAAYRVFRNLNQPGRFVLVPLTYQITRYSAEVTDCAYRPVILVYAVLDPESPEHNRIRYEAMLAPSISPVEYQELLYQLALEAQHPVLELPNMLASEAEYRWNLSSDLSVEVTTDRTPEYFHVGLSTDLASSLLLKSMIQNTGVSGEVRFTFEDGTILTSALSLNLAQITGPWPFGPIALRRDGGIVKLTNRIEGSLSVRDLVLFAAGRAPTRIAVEKQLNSGASLDVPITGAFDVACVDFATLGGVTATIEEIRSMIEDVQSNVVFVDLVNYDNYGLERLEVEARLKGVPGISRVRMENRRGTVDFLLPLTTYLEARIVEYRVNKVFRSKPSEITAWLEWNMETNNNIVSITWDSIR
jgi:hypothetical protein